MRRRALKFTLNLSLACAVFLHLENQGRESGRTAFTGLSAKSILSQVLASPGSARLCEAKRGLHTARIFGPSSEELEGQLDKHIATVHLYTDREIACLPAKWRTLLIGIKEGLKLPSMLKAARMMYIDILPLRTGGDFVMQGISEMIKEGSERVNSGIPDADLVYTSTLFDALDLDASGRISENNLRSIGLTSAAAAEIMDAVDIDGNRQIDLYEFMAADSDIFDRLGRHLASSDMASDLSSRDIQLIVQGMRIDNSGSMNSAKEARANEARFNEILQFIVDLDSQLGGQTVSSERLQTILAGSFDAVKNPSVVTALRVLYSEIAPIRVGSDMIYGIVSRCVDPAQCIVLD